MTSFTYQRVGGEYRIVFETDNKEAYTRMEEEAQRFIDWWMNWRFEAIPVANKIEVAQHFKCPVGYSSTFYSIDYLQNTIKEVSKTYAKD